VDADVIVVGAGLSGLVTAAELVAAGHRVLVCDGEPPQGLGGQAWWSFGGLFLVDSPEQRRLRISDSTELALADWLGAAAFDRDCDLWPRQWAEAFVHFAGGELRSWLHGIGVRWFPLVQWAERGGYTAPGHGNTVPRFHVTWGTGPGLVDPFLDRVRASPLARVCSRHLVEALSVGADGVTVSGVIREPSGVARGVPASNEVVAGFSYSAPAVVVAGGGIGGDHALVRRSWPAGSTAPARMISGVPAYVDGSLLAATEQVGGRVINPDRMWHYPEGVVNHSPVWPAHGIRILPGPSSLWLDAHGQRLPSPLFPGFDALGALRHITATGYDHSWFVCDLATVSAEFALSGSEQNADLTGKDVKLLAARAFPGPTPEVRAFLEHGVDFLQAGTVTELVEQMNALAGERLVNAEHLRGLIEARDAQVASGLGKDPQVVATRAARTFVGDRLIRVVKPHPLLDRSRPGEGLASRSAGPLVAVRLHVLTRKTLGGLETDLEGRVLRADGTPLPGVYAVGEAAGFGGGGMHGYRALEGTFLGGCLHTGRRTGQALAATLR
jgi:predicted oxidoreductase